MAKKKQEEILLPIIPIRWISKKEFERMYPKDDLTAIDENKLLIVNVGRN